VFSSVKSVFKPANALELQPRPEVKPATSWWWPQGLSFCCAGVNKHAEAEEDYTKKKVVREHL
jgi:hypothetical protein